MINRTTFYNRYTNIYEKLSPTQMDGYKKILDFWDSRSVLIDERWLAYILATAFHETDRRMSAVRECFCESDECSIRCVTRMYKKGKIKRNYAIPHDNGQSYFGRGLVQLTHGYNYKRIGKMIGLGNSLYDNPSLALELDISVKILCVGMLEGSFVPGHNLERYFNSNKTDWLGARKIVHGEDKKELIRDYALNFLSFIENTNIYDTSNEDFVVKAYKDTEKMRSKSGKIDKMTMPELDIVKYNEASIYLGKDIDINNLQRENYSEFIINKAANEKPNVLNYNEFEDLYAPGDISDTKEM